MSRGRLPLAVATLLALVVVLVPARPASAHGVGGVQPTDFESRIVKVSPELAGVTIRIRDLGETIELRNDATTDVVVLGYDREPYLRVGPDGVFRNARSPATFWNRARTPSGSLPDTYDANAEPRWEHLGDAPVARWHDHRAHWMGSERQVHGGEARVVSTWTITLVQGDSRSVVSGEIRFVPGPAPVPWLLVSVVLAAAITLAGRSSRWAVLLSAALVLLVAAEVLHVVGQWGATSGSVGTRLGAAAYSVLGIGFGTYALVRLAHPHADPYDATPVALVAALVMAIAGGLADIASLTRTFVPTTLPTSLARTLVTVSLGAGAGAVAVAARRLRRPLPEPAPATA